MRVSAVYILFSAGKCQSLHSITNRQIGNNCIEVDDGEHEQSALVTWPSDPFRPNMLLSKAKQE